MKWVISLPYYGAFLFDGTKREAEQRRCDKADWEGEIARKRRATPEEITVGRVILQEGDCGFRVVKRRKP